MKKWMTVVCLLIVAAFVLAACAPAAETASQAPESSTEPGEASVESSTEASAGTETTGSGKHAIVFKNTGNPYGEKEMEGFENAVKEAKEALNSEDNDKITAATEKLSKDIEPVFTKLYQQAAANGQAGANGANGAGAGADDTEFHQN